MTQTPDQPLSEDWVYIEHPEAGRSENPIPRASLDTWLSNGWSEVRESPRTQQQQQPAGQPAPAGGAQTNPQAEKKE
jgi:hypothetical protein